MEQLKLCQNQQVLSTLAISLAFHNLLWIIYDYYGSEQSCVAMMTVIRFDKNIVIVLGKNKLVTKWKDYLVGLKAIFVILFHQ